MSEVIPKILNSKLAAFLTDDERDRLADIVRRYDIVFEQHTQEVREQIAIKEKYADDNSFIDASQSFSEEDTRALSDSKAASDIMLNTLQELRELQRAIIRLAEIRYAESFQGDTGAIIAEAEEALAAIDKEDFEAYQDRVKGALLSPFTEEDQENPALRESILAILQMCKKDAESAAMYLSGSVSLQATAIAHYDDQDALARLQKITEKKAAAWYPPLKAGRSVRKVKYPIDKLNSVNSTIWNGLEAANGDGQINFYVGSIGKKKEPVTILYGIKFEDPAIEKKLRPFDKRVYDFIASRYSAGNEYMTAAEIYRDMGGTNEPNKTQKERILKSVKKMMGALVTIDNRDEAQKYKRKTYRTYTGNLLYAQIGEERYLNGAIVQDVIHLSEEPIMAKFAREREQITTFRKEVLQFPSLSLTDDNIIIENYLIEHIVRMKDGNAGEYLTYDTICDRCGITARDKKSRAKGKIAAALNDLKAAEWITDFTTDDKGVHIDHRDPTKGKGKGAKA